MDGRAEEHAVVEPRDEGQYPPGSVFKPVTALAAMQEHLVNPYSYLPCTGQYASKYDKAANRTRSTTGIQT